MTSMEKAIAWTKNPYFDEDSRREIQALIDQNQTKEIEERFYRDLEFGTGGLRSIMGAGLNRMNKYNIRKASQALSTEIKAHLPTGQKAKVCLSYDSRNNSFFFAKEAAGVFAANGIEAYIYQRLNPVAMLSFAVRELKAQAGVMVTASHNPPEYNGFKVFWADGAQVTPPYDENIIHHYNQLQDFSLIQYMDFEAGLSRGLIHWMNEEMESKYHRAIEATVVDKKLCLEKGNELKIVYTPIHGAGLIPCTTALKNIGFKNIEVVSEQAQPNGNFPTVKSPNPENPSALKMAVDLMIKTGADIAMGSDPDTDRLGVAFLDRNNEVIYVNGNQIGILKLHYILAQKKKMGQLKANSYFVKSIVTSSLQDHIAKAFQVETYNTLTGFKWICGKMNELEHTAPEKNFIFATEESFGYLSHTFARDKDGISSVTLMAEVALFYKLQGLNLNEALDKIYAEFGFSHETVLSIDYFGIEGQEKIARIMNNLREMKHSPLAFEELETLKDYKLGIEGLPKSNVLGFFFQSGNQLYARPSGTEPKIKFYLMIRETNGSLEEKKKNAYKKTEDALKIIKEFSEKA